MKSDMATRKPIKLARELAEPFRVSNGGSFVSRTLTLATRWA